VVCGAVLVAGATACGAQVPTAVPVPTFPAASVAPTTTSVPELDDGRLLPADCEQIVGHDELPGLFGLPVDSVSVRTVQGVPAPSVGRVERVDCTYTVTDPTAPLRGVVLRMTLGAYSDVASARAQHDRNVADQRAGASAVEKPDLGEAAATVVEHGPETVLLTSYEEVTVDLELPGRSAPLSPRDLLTDLARRVLARLAPAADTDSPQAG
jgi:hypothetical protein